MPLPGNIETLNFKGIYNLLPGSFSSTNVERNIRETEE